MFAYDFAGADNKQKRMVKSLTFAVTFGFPSLSPPIQDPNLIGVQVKGSDLPVCYDRSEKSKVIKRKKIP